MEAIKRKIEALAEQLVLGREDDPALLLEMHRRLGEMASEPGEGTPPGFAEALAATVRFVSGCDCEHPAAAIQVMSRALTALQALLAGGGAPGFPAEIGMGPSPSALAAAAPVPEAVDLELTPGFIVEAREHLENADVCLLKLEGRSDDPEALNAVFRAFHSIKGGAACLEFAEIKALAHETETLLDLARKGDLALSGPRMDVTFEAVDLMKKLIDGIQEFLRSGSRPGPAPELARLIGRIRGAVAPGATAAGPDPTPVGPIPGPRLPDPEPSLPGPGSGTASAVVREIVRVDAERLDRLIDLIGELVIAESMVSQSTDLRSRAGGGPLQKQVGQLDKITRELQEMGMSLRMIPLRSTFQKMARVVRDLSRKMEKPVQFKTAGEDIEVDKAIADRIADPLLHILRNSLDHGLESHPEARTRSGKLATGNIELRAFHREGSLFIEVEDDGRGLDREAILAKGIEKGLIRRGDALTDREVFNLIFLPGFSTAKVVTDVSGRGVGMDVVRRNVEMLRGHIDLQTEPGKRTVVSLRLPLTLAIIEGMVVRVGSERYILPTLSVTRLIRPGSKERSTVMGRGEMLSLQGDLIPLFRLDRLLSSSISPPGSDRGVAVIVEHEGQRAGLLADEVLGQQQIVIKSLGDAMERVPGVSGGAILPDGQVGLILDVSGLLRLAHSAGAMAAA